MNDKLGSNYIWYTISIPLQETPIFLNCKMIPYLLVNIQYFRRSYLLMLHDMYF